MERLEKLANDLYYIAECLRELDRITKLPNCNDCGKLRFAGISVQPIPPDAEVKLRWYRCTQCKAMEWVMCHG